MQAAGNGSVRTLIRCVTTKEFKLNSTALCFSRGEMENGDGFAGAFAQCIAEAPQRHLCASPADEGAGKK
jgi:hypothetical protein